MEIKEEILKTIEIIVDSKIGGLKFDRTERGLVVEVLSDKNYVVLIDGVRYTIQYKKETLKVNDLVYVMIPKNNLKNMFIVG